MKRNPIVRVTIVAAAVATLASCNFIPGAITDESQRTAESANVQYINVALDYMQANSVRRDSINWPAFRGQVLAFSKGSTTASEAYNALRYAVTMLGDNHSRFQTPSEVIASTADPAPTLGTIPSARAIEDGIGYVYIPSFSGLNQRGRVDSTQRVIRDVDESMVIPPCGWIVDVRGNGGGNMYPMIGGVGPILGEGVMGYFVRGGSLANSEWFYNGGSAGTNGAVIVNTPTAYPLRKPNPPVAVLHNGGTASSGEATVISFRGRANTRSFGQPTNGRSTGNASIPLSDGARLILTTSRMADRTGRVYGGQVQPDSLVPSASFTPGVVDLAVTAARNWLRERPECAGRN